MTIQAKDAYTWMALYKDHQALAEDDAANGFASIDQERVNSVFLIPKDLTSAMHRVSIPEGAQAVCFRRRGVVFHADERVQIGATVHCIGWKREESAVYLFVSDDGTTLLTDDLQAI